MTPVKSLPPTFVAVSLLCDAPDQALLTTEEGALTLSEGITSDPPQDLNRSRL
jgi:hypothetical protein